VCEALGEIGEKNAAPYLASALRDPVWSVSEWACWALEGTNDPTVLPALMRYESRVLTLRVDPASENDCDRLLARVARTRLMLGDERARESLVALLLSREPKAREIAIGALERRYGDDRGYSLKADEAERREAVKRWMK